MRCLNVPNFVTDLLILDLDRSWSAGLPLLNLQLRSIRNRTCIGPVKSCNVIRYNCDATAIRPPRPRTWPRVDKLASASTSASIEHLASACMASVFLTWPRKMCYPLPNNTGCIHFVVVSLQFLFEISLNTYTNDVSCFE